MSSEEQSEGGAEDVFAALGDELSREILAAAASEVVTASTLAESLDVSAATVYRRLNRLESLDFIHEVSDIRQGPSSETGYRTDLRTLVLIHSESGFDVRRAEGELQAAVSLFLDHVDVTEAGFRFDEGEATVTLSMDDETLAALHDGFRNARNGDGAYLEPSANQ
jgi:DNA-binding transcriptional ArsR family regulator